MERFVFPPGWTPILSCSVSSSGIRRQPNRNLQRSFENVRQVYGHTPTFSPRSSTGAEIAYCSRIVGSSGRDHYGGPFYEMKIVSCGLERSSNGLPAV